MKRTWSTDDFEKIAENNEFIKEAAEQTNGLVKTAEDAEMFRQGLIFGMGQRIGMNKVAGDLTDQMVAGNVSNGNPDPKTVTPTQVPTTDTVTPAIATQEIKQQSDKMLPAQFYAFVMQNGLQDLVKNNSELAPKFEEGKAVVNGTQAHNATGQQRFEQYSAPAQATMGNTSVPSAPGM
jgi:hypothetical protein